MNNGIGIYFVAEEMLTNLCKPPKRRSNKQSTKSKKNNHQPFLTCIAFYWHSFLGFPFPLALISNPKNTTHVFSIQK